MISILDNVQFSKIKSHFYFLNKLFTDEYRKLMRKKKKKKNDRSLNNNKRYVNFRFCFGNNRAKYFFFFDYINKISCKSRELKEEKKN